MTAFCVDVSGSMSRKDIDRACTYVREQAKPGDVVIFFDHRVVHCDDALTFSIEKNRDDWCGGTDATQALELSRQKGCTRNVLISDLFLPEEQLRMFDEKVYIAAL